MLASRKYGVPLSVTLMIANMLKDAHYLLEMETGLASQGYSHDENLHPIYRTGQGSGNSPAIWCFISSTLFICYDKILANKAVYFDPTKNLEITLGMTGYVDDCEGQTNEWCLDPKENTDRLIAKVSHTMHNVGRTCCRSVVGHLHCQNAVGISCNGNIQSQEVWSWSC